MDSANSKVFRLVWVITGFILCYISCEGAEGRCDGQDHFNVLNNNNI